MPTYGFTKISTDRLVGKAFDHELDADGKHPEDTIRIKDIARVYAKEQGLKSAELVLVKFRGSDDHRPHPSTPRWPLI